MQSIGAIILNDKATMSLNGSNSELGFRAILNGYTVESAMVT